MRIGVLCSHPFGFPAIDLLHSSGVLAGIAGPPKNDLQAAMKAMANQYFVDYSIIRDEQDEALRIWIDEITPDMVFVLGFPFKIQEKILRKVPLGFFNFHTGLIPEYRGIDPVFWQIRNSEPLGGITIHLMDSEFDIGPVAHVETVEIPPDETYGLHLQRLAWVAREAVNKLLKKIKNNDLKLFPQNKMAGQFLKRPSFDELMIQWETQSANSIKQLVQASNPAYGGAITFYKGASHRLIQVSVVEIENGSSLNIEPGTIFSQGNEMIVACADGKALIPDIIYCDAGLLTGRRYLRAFDVRKGDKLVANQL